MRATSCKGFSATTIWAVEQLGFAMMFFFAYLAMAPALTSGTTRGTSASMRHLDELSMTTGPMAPILGDHSADTVLPADMRTMSVPRKS